MTTIQTLLQEGAAALDKSPTPRLDAELLLSAVTGTTRAHLMGFSERSIDAAGTEKFRALIARRAKREPVAYLTGKKEFYGLEFEVSPAVLIPRPETELLVEKGIEFLADATGLIRILDLGTGSGCIALALAMHAKKAGRRFEILAVDKSSAALDVAQRNAQRLNLADAVQFLESDWFGTVPSRGAFNLIIANPPYIPDGSSACAPETAFEPAAALYSGASGLRDLETILRQVPAFLSQRSLFLSEIGADQAAAVLGLWEKLHGTLPCRKEILCDFSGLNRIFAVERT